MILNLTQHDATADQIAAGVTELPTGARTEMRALLTFEALPSRAEILSRAERIAAIATLFASPEDRGDDNGFTDQAMIGGAPYLMSALESALTEHGIEPVYAFSTRESAEQTQLDGSVKKTNVFRHAGFVQAAGN